jgi:hypothetical protein
MLDRAQNPRVVDEALGNFRAPLQSVAMARFRELAGELDEECLYDLGGSAGHPRVEIDEERALARSEFLTDSLDLFEDPGLPGTPIPLPARSPSPPQRRLLA